MRVIKNNNNFESIWWSVRNENNIPQTFFNRQNSDREYFYENNQDFQKLVKIDSIGLNQGENDHKDQIKLDALNPNNAVEAEMDDEELCDFDLDLKKPNKGSKTYDEVFDKLSLESSGNNLFCQNELNTLPKIDNKSENMSEVCNNSFDAENDIEVVKMPEDAQNSNICSNNDDSQISEINLNLGTDNSWTTNTKPLKKKPVSKTSKKSKTTEFAYLLERKAFRMMRKYYKEKFEFEIDLADYKKRLPIMHQSELNQLVVRFMHTEFEFLSSLLTEADYARTRDALKTIILWDRYRKRESISEGLDFSPLRNVLHKYNTRNLIELISDASYSFLFTHFFLMQGKKVSEEQEDVDSDKLIQRMRHLMAEASNYLPKEINSLFEEIHSSIYK